MPVLETKNLEKILNTARNNRKFHTRAPRDLVDHSLLTYDSADKTKNFPKAVNEEPVTEEALISSLTSRQLVRPVKKVTRHLRSASCSNSLYFP